MSVTKLGDTIRVHYSGRLEDGSVFDDTTNRGPLEFKIGDGSLVPGFQKAVVGMTVGDKKTITLKPTEAFGDPKPGRVGDIPKTQFPPQVEQKVGQRFQWTQPDGGEAIATIVGVKKHFITLDVNHPLAGKKVTFDIELVGIVE
jgi:peptidylprolyl isomerase